MRGLIDAIRKESNAGDEFRNAKSAVSQERCRCRAHHPLEGMCRYKVKIAVKRNVQAINFVNDVRSSLLFAITAVIVFHTASRVYRRFPEAVCISALLVCLRSHV